jgi:hypothetical protein
MNELKEFSDQLRLYFKGNPKSRPFVCDGNPLECQIFIVGYNAATEMKKEFSHFWDDELGFKKKNWEKEYEQERESLGKPGISPTRERINRITEAENTFLETNIYFTPSSKEKDLKAKDKVSIFRFLLEEIKPRVVLLHGRRAVKFFNKLEFESLKINEEKKVILFGIETVIVTRPHLSRMSYEKAIALGQDLKRMRVNVIKHQDNNFNLPLLKPFKMKTEDVFQVGAEGGGLSITRQEGESETKFIYHHSEFDPTGEGLDVNKKYEYSNFEEPFAIINKYSWHMLYIITLHGDYRNFIIEKLIDKLNTESVQPNYFEYNKNNMEQILKIELRCLIGNDDKPNWSFSQQLNN